MWLDLGTVAELAEVTVNGKSAGIAWKAPYRVDITDSVKAGDNLLQVRVADLWVNRLIGDQQPNAKQYTFTVRNPYKANSPLVPGGTAGAGAADQGRACGEGCREGGMRRCRIRKWMGAAVLGLGLLTAGAAVAQESDVAREYGAAQRALAAGDDAGR